MKLPVRAACSRDYRAPGFAPPPCEPPPACSQESLTTSPESETPGSIQGGRQKYYGLADFLLTHFSFMPACCRHGSTNIYLARQSTGRIYRRPRCPPPWRPPCRPWSS